MEFLHTKMYVKNIVSVQISIYLLGFLCGVEVSAE